MTKGALLATVKAPEVAVALRTPSEAITRSRAVVVAFRSERGTESVVAVVLTASVSHVPPSVDFLTVVRDRHSGDRARGFG